MKYGDEFKKEIKDEKYHKKESGSIAGDGKGNPDKKTDKKDKAHAKASIDKKKVMAGKMDKYMTNMECDKCGGKHSTKHHK